MLAVLRLGVTPRVVEHFPLGLLVRARLLASDVEVCLRLGEVVIGQDAAPGLDLVGERPGEQMIAHAAGNVVGFEVFFSFFLFFFQINFVRLIYLLTN